MKPPNENGDLSAAAIANPAKDVDVLGESVKASGRTDLDAAQSGPRRIAQWFTHALCLTELAASNPRALKMLRVHLEAMRGELCHE
jgi:hypothetical protein